MPAATSFDRHGQIRCGTISVVNIERSVALYRDYLHLQVVEEGSINSIQALAWGLSGSIGARYVVLQPSSQAPSFIRLVEVPMTPSYAPAKSLGWNAFEITVRDVFLLAEQIESSDFTIVGPPKLVDGFTSFIPMQVIGPDGEVLFLNQVNHSDEDTDLPIAQAEVDVLFIVVVASADREASVQDHMRLGFDRGATHNFRYSLINRAFGLPAETQQTITMVQPGRMPFAQIDQYPENHEIRPQHSDCLPIGNSIVSVMVDNIDALGLDDLAVAPAQYPEGIIYQGRKTQVIQGSASELIELIEIN